MKLSFIFTSFLIAFPTLSWGLDVELDDLRVQSKSNMAQYLSETSDTLENWTQNIVTQNVDLFCFGESHTELYRSFYEELLPKMNLDGFLIEARDEKAQELISASLTSSDTVLLENAPISGIIRSLQTSNPQITFHGVDQTRAQDKIELDESLEKGFENKSISRESFIALNTLSVMEPSKTYGALYGSLHCPKNDIRLPYSKSFFRLVTDSHPQINAKSVYVAFRSTNTEFVKTLMGFNFYEKSFVIADTNTIDMEKLNHRVSFQKYIENYDIVIYVNDKP